MFHTESVKLSACGIQFQLPPGFTLLESEEPHVNSTLELCAPDNSYHITISLDRSEHPSAAELQSILSEGGYTLLTPIVPFTHNGISGHSASYLSGKCGYWELRLDLPDAKPDAPNTLVIQLSTHLGRDILKLMNVQPLQFLLQSIQTLSK